MHRDLRRALVLTDRQSVDVQMRQLTRVGCKKVLREVARDEDQATVALRQILARTRQSAQTPSEKAGNAKYRCIFDKWGDRP